MTTSAITTIDRPFSSVPNSCVPRARRAEAASDGVLLERFVRSRDEAAFAELVDRHGAMVLGVCQRILHNRHDAEDCFQAVFLVLVRKAATVRPRQMVGNWLYGVAFRTALEARKMTARRRVIERKKSMLPAAESEAERWHALRPILDQELERLPDKYRILVILCDLEGKTRKEAAGQLGLPEGTAASRLARGRRLLANRLARRSVAFSVATLAVVLAQNAHPAAVPDWLACAATRLAAGENPGGIVSPMAVTLAARIVGSMLLTRLTIAGAAFMLLLVLGLGAGAFIPAAQAERKIEAKKSEPHRPRTIPVVNAEVSGIVKIIDLKQKLIALILPEGNVKLETLQVAEDAEVLIDGKKASLADVTVGLPVTLHVSENRVVAIIAPLGKKP